MSGTGANAANTTVLMNTSKAPKKSKRIGGIRTMPSVLGFFQFILYFEGKVLFQFFMKTFLLCFLCGTVEWKTKLVLVKKQRLSFFFFF